MSITRFVHRQALFAGLVVAASACSVDEPSTTLETPASPNDTDGRVTETAPTNPGSEPAAPATPAPAPTTAAANKVLRGVNMWTLFYTSGWSKLTEPQSSFDFLGARGIKVIRLPFAWEPLQPTLGGDLDAAYLTKVKDQITKAANAGMQTILDLHDYNPEWDARPASAVGSKFQVAHFADLWRRLSLEFKDDTRVVAYDLQNEPNEISTAAWQTSSKAAAQAIRGNGDQKLLWVESINWSAVQDFAQVTPWMNDPNVMYSGHEYFEYSGSYRKGFDFGAYAAETSTALSRLKTFTDWCQTHQVRCSIGEVGWPSSRRSSSWQQWNALAEQWYQAADAANLWVTYWTAGSAMDEVQVAYDAPANSANPLPGVSVAETQSLVIEKHPSF